jgi:4-amino-4-deoxy-L-arabinose transferase-like glycosyltransferase
MAYILLPLALAGWQEWAAHLLMLAFFATTIVGIGVLAKRLGLPPWTQRAAALLAASAPVALGMAGTVMPDIPATMFAVWGMERYIAWTQQRRLWTALAAVGLLSLAILTRINLLLLLPVASFAGRRLGWRSIPPLVLAIAVVFAAFVITRDPSPAGGTAASAAGGQLRFDRAMYHLLALLIAALTTTPLVLALITRRRWEPAWILWLWLLIPLPIVAYIHFAAKYLVASLPATAILAAYGLERLRYRRAALALATGFGTALGVAILRADASMSRMGRDAAIALIQPRVAAGERVWFSGHWGFHWYAEAAGAQPMSLDPPYPGPGDIVVSSTVDRPDGRAPRVPGILLQTWGTQPAGGQVMSRPAGAGFYSDTWGLWPWSWGPSHGNGFQVWRIEP